MSGMAAPSQRATRAAVERAIERLSSGIASAFDARITVDFDSRYPPTVNSVAEAELCRRAAARVVGEARVRRDELPSMGAEDFAYMLQAKPGAYCFIANGDGAHREMGHGGGPCTLHNPSYDFNDDLIPLGATYWVKLAEEWLAQAARAA